jgi:hypothetical protein
MKFSWAISRVKCLGGEKTDVSKTTSVLVLRVLIYNLLVYEFQIFSYKTRKPLTILQ